MTKYAVTLEPNRSNPPRFAALTCYERRGNKVTRLLKRYNRGAVTGTKVIPFDRNKDWSRVPGERYVWVPVNDKPVDVTPEQYLEGCTRAWHDQPCNCDLPVAPRFTKDTKRTKVQQTAKRDWLIAAGYVRLSVDLTVELEWVPGDCVWADKMDADEGREVTCYEDIDEDTEDCAITGGHFKVKE